MKFIKPIVGLSKIIQNYDAVICGFNGVLSKGDGVNTEALHALLKCHEAGVSVAVVSNSAKRVAHLADILGSGRPWQLSFLTAVISAGEILHYQLKNFEKTTLPGKRFYNVGGNAAAGIFDGLDYQAVNSPDKADFVFAGDVRRPDDMIEKYIPELEHACTLGLPFLSAGNDVSTYGGGEICLGSGALAEQYAVMGGKIMTVGKPDAAFLNYCRESFKTHPSKILMIGDDFATDIKSADFLGAESLLISKGIHVNLLGEGYIPDVEKVRGLAMNFDLYPDYVMSGLRW